MVSKATACRARSARRRQTCWSAGAGPWPRAGSDICPVVTIERHLSTLADGRQYWADDPGPMAYCLLRSVTLPASLRAVSVLLPFHW
ncbi:hypothetical protein GCM10010193_38000 [Kitasatospora atroaurantiaca]